VLSLVMVATHVRAEELSIQFENHTIEQGKLTTSLSITGDISYDTIDAIRNGITAKFFVTFQLSSSARFIGRSRTTFVETIESFNISYDVWENSYILHDNRQKNTLVARNSGDILYRINDATSPLVTDVTAMDWNDRLYMRAKIKIQTIRLFPPFGIFLLFFDPWNFESSWIQTEVNAQEL
ncbi:MAG: hypothetical protein AMS17_16930, partial [Spirochaetes bacterium DG_61]